MRYARNVLHLDWILQFFSGNSVPQKKCTMHRIEEFCNCRHNNFSVLNVEDAVTILIASFVSSSVSKQNLCFRGSQGCLYPVTPPITHIAVFTDETADGSFSKWSAQPRVRSLSAKMELRSFPAGRYRQSSAQFITSPWDADVWVLTFHPVPDHPPHYDWTVKDQRVYVRSFYIGRTQSWVISRCGGFVWVWTNPSLLHQFFTAFHSADFVALSKRLNTLIDELEQQICWTVELFLFLWPVVLLSSFSLGFNERICSVWQTLSHLSSWVIKPEFFLQHNREAVNNAFSRAAR